MNAHEFTCEILLFLNDPSVTASNVPLRIASFSHESLPADFTSFHNHVLPHFSKTSHSVVAATTTTAATCLF
jgi:hypothetical protein